MPRTHKPPPPPDWRGWSPPHYTQVPDDLFDLWLPVLTEGQLKVLLYIMRRTFGFKKQEDAISLSQLCEGIVTYDGRRLDHGTGCTRSTVTASVAALVDYGLILAVAQTDPRGDAAATLYRLRMVGEEGSLINRPPQSNKRTTPGPSTRPPVVQPTDPQETVVQETARQETGDSNRPALQKKERGTTTTIRRRMNTAGEGTPPPATRPRPALSSYIAGVIEDISRDLGDLDHSNSNITQALRLWQEADLDEVAFVALLREVKGTVRHYQAGGIGNKMAYFFQTLRDRVSKQDGHA